MVRLRHGSVDGHLAPQPLSALLRQPSAGADEVVVVGVSVVVGISSVTVGAGAGSSVVVIAAGGATVLVGVVVQVAEVTATDCDPPDAISDRVQTPAESVDAVTAEVCRLADDTVRITPSVHVNSAGDTLGSTAVQVTGAPASVNEKLEITSPLPTNCVGDGGAGGALTGASGAAGAGAAAGVLAPGVGGTTAGASPAGAPAGACEVAFDGPVAMSVADDPVAPVDSCA